MVTGRSSIRFQLNGRAVELSREQVEESLRSVVPRPIQTHSVKVNGVWFPVRQAFAIGTGIPASEFTSHTARRHLGTLGFELHGEIASRDEMASDPAREAGRVTRAADTKKSTEPGAPEEWHTEANVQASVVRALVVAGWKIRSVANTATKEHGVDVVAERDGKTMGVEVKGYPSRQYADPARASETKRAQPSTQAGHWYAAAVLAAMRLRGREPESVSAIALPDFARYRNLYTETAESLAAAHIEVWWVSDDGRVTFPTTP